MTKLSHLFSENTSSDEWLRAKDAIKSSIDIALDRGNCNDDILLLMKDLLDDIKICTSMNAYVDEVSDGK